MDVPLPLLTAYAQAVPTLRAEESLTHIADARAGRLQVKPSAVREHVRGLERQASAGTRARPADQRRLRAAGITVEHQKTNDTKG